MYFIVPGQLAPGRAPAKGPLANNWAALPLREAADGTLYFSGNANIDATLIGSKWTVKNLTYSFPSSGAIYGAGYENGINKGFDDFNPLQRKAARAGLDLIASYTNLTFTEVTESAAQQAVLRFAQTSSPEVGSAQGSFPSPLENAGDIWFGKTGQPYYTTPMKGNWGWATIFHEIGHTLGLKHGHQDYSEVDLSADLGVKAPRPGTGALPADHDGQAWSLMTYTSYPGADLSIRGDMLNEPQTYMQNDIAALQFLYGADFSTHAGTTVYRWNTKTGEMSLNGKGQGRPTTNKVFATIWDGGGTDTYDLRNYKSDLTVDLRPGAFSTFSPQQLADVEEDLQIFYSAPGNIANALLYRGDGRSLIERAYGGRGDDVLTGNNGDNVLVGGHGRDTLKGTGGHDLLVGSSGDDLLVGGAGRDELRGSHGGDRLSGGRDADTFVYKSIWDSTLLPSGQDQILDFSSRERDKIDLQGIDASNLRTGDQAFLFIGGQAFTGRAGELRYEASDNGLLLSGDVSGDGAADFAIALKGVSTVARGDFHL